MKNTLNNLFLAVFLGLISQGIQAQFDDIYYDPDHKESSKEIRNDQQKDTYSHEESNRISTNETGYSYDDENSEWSNQDYYYSSRIKRFHRPYLGFDYYNGAYVDNYFYDPYGFNPYYYNQDIYVSSCGYNDYYRWRRWQFSPWHSYSYWNQWDWNLGWSSYPFSYGYCPFSGYYNNYWSYNYGNYPYYGGGSNYWNNNENRNHPNGTHFGSRRFGLTNTSNRGPVRVMSPSPRTFTEATGTSVNPSPNRNNPSRVVRSADGDVYRPGPVAKPDGSTKTNKLPGTNSKPTERTNDRRGSTPGQFPGERNTPSEIRHIPRAERSNRSERIEDNKPEFRPERIHRDGGSERSSNPTPRTEMPREKPRESFPSPRESRPEPKIERRQERNDNFRSRSESSGSRSENNHSSGDGGRRSRR